MTEPAIEIKFTLRINDVPEAHRAEAERKAQEAFVMALLRQGDISAGRAAELMSSACRHTGFTRPCMCRISRGRMATGPSLSANPILISSSDTSRYKRSITGTHHSKRNIWDCSVSTG